MLSIEYIDATYIFLKKLTKENYYQNNYFSTVYQYLFIYLKKMHKETKYLLHASLFPLDPVKGK